MSEQPTNNSPFNKIKTRFVILWLCLFYFGFAALYGTIAGIGLPLPELEDPLVNNLIYTCTFLSLTYLLLNRLRQARIFPQYLRGDAFPQYRWWYLLRLTLVFLLFSVGTGLLSFYLLFLIVPEYTQSLLESFSDSSASSSSLPVFNQLLATINLVIIAPITEEFIFRGIILHRLATKWNIPVAVWVSSIIFGLLHPNPLGIGAVGMAWALIYLKTKSLIVPMVAHAMNNGIVAISQFFSFLLTENQAESLTEITAVDWLGCLLIIAISAPLAISFLYQKFPSQKQILPYFANQQAIASK